MSAQGMTFTVLKNQLCHHLDDDGMDISLMSRKTKHFLRSLASYICELEEVKQAAIAVSELSKEEDDMRILRLAIKNTRGLA